MSNTFTGNGARVLRLGTRGSALARAQTELVIGALQRVAPGVQCDVVIIRTQGDVRTDVPLTAIGGQGVFAVELEQALARADIDVAVHSAKDLPSTLAPGMDFAAILPRADARDVLVVRDGLPRQLRDLPSGARVGTSSPRRSAQLRRLRPDLVHMDIRGNVDTRLRKLDGGEYDALLLASAGLVRLGLEHRIAECIDMAVMVPAVGQGAIAVECRADDSDVRSLFAGVDHRNTHVAVQAERAFLARLGVGCNSPTGAHATCRESGQLRIDGFLQHDGGQASFASMHGVAGDAIAIGAALAEQLLGMSGATPSAAAGQAAP